MISLAILEDLAGTTAFRRGEEYFSIGAVGRLRATDDKVTARVDGSESYQVELRDDDGDLAYDCTCPRAADGYFCKHCVAVGLAWLAAETKPKSKGGKAKRRDPWRDIKDHLATQSPETLIELLLDVAQRDDGFVDWREVGTFAGNIDQVLESLAELLKPDTAASLVELAEYATERVENALEQLDDSNGEVSGTVYGLGELHQKACAMARPETEFHQAAGWRGAGKCGGITNAYCGV